MGQPWVRFAEVHENQGFFPSVSLSSPTRGWEDISKEGLCSSLLSESPAVPSKQLESEYLKLQLISGAEM